MGEKEKQELDFPLAEAFIVGLVSGSAALVLRIGIRWLGETRVQAAESYSPYLVLPLFGLVGGLIAGLLVDRIAPEAAGSGIPQVKAALMRIRMALDLRIALTKLLGGMIALGSGLFLGREGPTVQLGAAIAASMTRKGKTSARHRRELIAAGAGAGLAAAFNAPLAGVTFVLEELLKDIRTSTVLTAMAAAAGPALLINLFAHYSHLPDQLNIVDATEWRDLPFYILLGIACAIMGSLFNVSVINSLNLYRRAKTVPTWLKVAFAGCASGLIVACLPAEFRNYTEMRSVVVEGKAGWMMMPVVFVEYFLLTLLAYGSGAPGGLFAPCLLLGGTLGYLIGSLEHAITGNGSPTTFALVGMGAFFAGVGRVPLTATVITFELTTSFTLVTPLLVSCSIASFLGDKIVPGSLYDNLMIWNGIHLRKQPELATEGEHSETKRFRTMTAREVMQRFGDRTVPSRAKISSVINLLRASTLRGVPVVDRGKLVGVLSQTDLRDLLHMENPPETVLVKDLMSPNPVSVSPDDSLNDILFLFSNFKFTWLPVTEDDKFIGIINQSDVLAALFSDTHETVAATVEDDKQSNKGSHETARNKADESVEGENKKLPTD